MTHEEAKQALHEACAAISVAATLLRPHLPLFERFEKERRDMQSFGAVAHPTLYRDEERRAVSALVSPLFIAAQNYLREVDTQTQHAAAALEKVGAAP